LKALTAGCEDLAVTNQEQAMAVKRAVIAAIVGQFGHPRGTAGTVAGHRLPASYGGQGPAARQIQALLPGAGYTKTRTEALDLEPAVACVLAVNPDPACYRSPPASDLTS
jgi:hypothetical protein